MPPPTTDNLHTAPPAASDSRSESATLFSDARSGSVTLVELTASGFLFYAAGSLIAVLGVYFGFTFMELCDEHPVAEQSRPDFLSAFAAWDGRWQVQVVEEGYDYHPRINSRVAYFPAYPLTAQAIARSFNLRVEVALLIVSHLALWGACCALLAYARARYPRDGDKTADAVLLCFALFPTTFFLSMTYSESLFLLFAILAMLGMLRRWNVLLIALVIGAATATRSVGVALLVPFWLHLWETSRSRWPFAGKAIVLTPLACWGLLAFMAWQWHAFDEPLAFVKTQAHWSERELTFGERAIGLLTLEPVRAVYDPDSPCYWSRVPPRGEPLLNLKFLNPVYVLFTIAILALGAGCRWLDRRELALSAVLLMIPLWLQAGRLCMSGQARFAAVVFPMYLVLGKLAPRIGFVPAAALLAGCAILKCLYSAMFASWRWFY